MPPDFGAFYAQEHDAQVRRAALLVGSSDVANDLVHDAMLAMYERWDQIREPAAYLNRAVLNRCRDHGRRAASKARGLRRTVEQPDVPPPADPLWDLFDGLPFNQRAAVVLRYYAGLTTAQIAEAMNCPQGSIGPWIDRALASMKEQLR
jgi:RNA polymerase sigma factor (sigma-70 family)